MDYADARSRRLRHPKSPQQRDYPVDGVCEEDHQPDQEQALIEPHRVGQVCSEREKTGEEHEQKDGGAELPDVPSESHHGVRAAFRLEPVVPVREADPLARYGLKEFRREIQGAEYEDVYAEHDQRTARVRRPSIRCSARPEMNRNVTRRNGQGYQRQGYVC